MDIFPYLLSLHVHIFEKCRPGITLKRVCTQQYPNNVKNKKGKKDKDEIKESKNDDGGDEK